MGAPMDLKLARLKTWLSCEDAANYLAALLDEPVTVTDVFQLASEGLLQLTAYFPSAQPARRMEVVPKARAKKMDVFLPPAVSDSNEMVDPKIARFRWLLENQSAELDSADLYALLHYLQTKETTENESLDTQHYALYCGIPLDDFSILEEHGAPVDIRGYWNLEPIGGGLTAIKNSYLELIDAAANDQISWSGIILRSPYDRNSWTALKEQRKGFSENVLRELSDAFNKAGWGAPPSALAQDRLDEADSLPENSHIVVHFKELQRFLTSLENAESNVVMQESAGDQTELHRTQRTLAALALGLAAKPGTYNKAGKPNVSQLAKLATEHLRDGQNDRTPHGFSESTVRQTITDALNACPELKV
tara:strand:- start:579 stop:1667 length:1089 start_codon:yes stop_codon:yes gene_type:complete